MHLNLVCLHLHLVALHLIALNKLALHLVVTLDQLLIHSIQLVESTVDLVLRQGNGKERGIQRIQKGF